MDQNNNIKLPNFWKSLNETFYTDYILSLQRNKWLNEKGKTKAKILQMSSLGTKHFGQDALWLNPDESHKE